MRERSDYPSGSEDNARPWPALDLAAAVVWVLLLLLVLVVPLPGEQSLRFLLGVPYLLFVPGYVLVVFLYPEHPAEEDEASIGGPARVVLSVVASFGLTAVVAAVLSATPLGVRPVPTVGVVLVLVLLLAIGATYRRNGLPRHRRFRPPVGRTFDVLLGPIADLRAGRDLGTNAAVIFAVLALVLTTGYVVSSPAPGESFTEFAVLTEDEDGELVAGNYPEQLGTVANQPLFVEVTNQEGATVDYTVVVQLQRVQVEGNATTVLEREELDRASRTVENGASWREEFTFDPTTTGERLRLTFLLYEGAVPATPTQTNAYRTVYLWVDVE